MAFKTIVLKIEASQNGKWVYFLKNLIILDICVDEHTLLDKLAETHFNSIESFVETNPKYKPMQADLFIKKYYELIRKKAVLYT